VDGAGGCAAGADCVGGALGLGVMAPGAGCPGGNIGRVAWAGISVMSTSSTSKIRSDFAGIPG